jgi:hypothetical protein
MAVIFDAVGPGVTGQAVTSFSWTHTPVGTPTAVGIWYGGYVASLTTFTVTYGGAAMTTGTWYGVVNAQAAISFSLANPPAGASTISMTWVGGSMYVSANSITVTGSDTTTCFRNSSGNRVTGSASSSTSVTSANGDLVVDCVASLTANAAPTGPGASQTSRYTSFWNTNLGFGLSTQPGATGTVTATWTTTNAGTGGDGYATAIDSFKAAAVAVVPQASTLPIMGVG